MKSLIIIMTVLVMALGFSTFGFAGSDQQNGQMGSVCGVTGDTYTGRISSTSQAGDRIVVNGAEGDKASSCPAQRRTAGFRLTKGSQ